MPEDSLSLSYHNFSIFGLENGWWLGHYEENQQAKSPIIIAYIAFAIAKCRERIKDNVTFTELFCADGFYAMAASLLGCNKSVGIDKDSASLKTARKMTRLAGLRDTSFVEDTIRPDSKFASTDIVANVGGLYHVSEPEKILAMSFNMARRFLIVQSVVSLARTEPDYFQAPGPGSPWGNRYNRHSFDTMLRRACPGQIVDQHFNELEGNSRPEDRGSVYYLIQKDGRL